MSPRRRPPRAWLGEPRPVDPSELLGPRGLTAAVLAGQGEAGEQPEGGPGGAGADAEELQGDDAFLSSLLTPERRARIESVLAARLGSVTLVLDRLIDPHNVAAILRTAEGMGLCGVHLVPHDDGDLVAHRRVTRDADKWIEVAQHPSGAAAARALRAQGYTVYAAHLGAETRLLQDLPAGRPLALLLGNEHEGPSAETLAACDGSFRIPMAGFTQSFNVSVAAALALQQATQARRAALGRAGDLSPEALARLRSRYLRLGAKLARRLRSLPGPR